MQIYSYIHVFLLKTKYKLKGYCAHVFILSSLADLLNHYIILGLLKHFIRKLYSNYILYKQKYIYKIILY